MKDDMYIRQNIKYAIYDDVVIFMSYYVYVEAN